MTDATQPTAEELEISVFGPGVGECVLLHLGRGDWVVVDSCLDGRTKQQPALAYLDRIGVDVATSVKIVAISHWHQDHSSGISQVVRACTNSIFVCSSALRTDEFRALLNLRRAREDVESTGLNELDQTFTILKERSVGQPPVPPMAFASARTEVWHRDAEPGTPDAELVALTPSAASQVMAMQALESLMPEPGTPRRPLPERTENASSMALWARLGDVCVLLGADLQNTGHPGTGWNDVTAQHPARLGRAVVYKVAHHGSDNAHLPAIWTDLLTPEPIAVLTPFRKSHLPTAADRLRICGAAAKAYITASPGDLPSRLPAQVRAAAGSSSVSLREESGSVGHVRVRLSPAAQPSIGLGHPARNLC